MEVTRRQFLRVGAAGTVGGSVLGGGSALGFDIAMADQVKQSLRIQGATVSHSVCPYCAVGCALLAYTKKNGDGKTELLQIEGNPDSPRALIGESEPEEGVVGDRVDADELPPPLVRRARRLPYRRVRGLRPSGGSGIGGHGSGPGESPRVHERQ